MRGMNKAIIFGNVGNDPEIKYTQDGTCIASLSIATTEKFKNRAGELVEETEWNRIKVFGKAAEVVGEYVKKGDEFGVEGKIKTRKYEKDGVTHYATEIKATEIHLCGGKRDGGGGTGNGTPRRNAPAQRRDPEQGKQSFDDVPFDDDIPFATNRGMY